MGGKADCFLGSTASNEDDSRGGEEVHVGCDAGESRRSEGESAPTWAGEEGFTKGGSFVHDARGEGLNFGHSRKPVIVGGERGWGDELGETCVLLSGEIVWTVIYIEF